MQKITQQERVVAEFMLALVVLGAGYVISLYFKYPETGYFFGMVYLLLIQWGNKTLRKR